MTEQTTTKTPLPIASLSFENAMSELEKIVRNLENGKIGLEESITEYERGDALRKHCESKLRDATLRVETLSLNAAGQPQRDPFDSK